jgi:hypothetical protein
MEITSIGKINMFVRHLKNETFLFIVMAIFSWKYDSSEKQYKIHT